MFTLPVYGDFDNQPANTKLKFKTTGLISSMGGAYCLLLLLGEDNVNVGCWGEPVRFVCTKDDVETIRKLLEERLQEDVFDRDRSSLVFEGVY